MVITHPMASLWIFAAILCAGMMSVASGEEPHLGAHPVSVVVSNFRNTHGFLGCRLYRSAEGFPESGTDLSESRVRVAGAATRCEFQSVAPGTYAVAVMHDENDNRKLDKNFLGIPIEGCGVSNNKTYAMSTPKWSESTFQVGAQDVVLSIVLRY
jgi:uncharacterized protein (DUF2141 family)